MTLHEKRCLRARAGLFLCGPMPSYRDLMRALQVTRGAAIQWRWQIGKARKEFAA